MTVNNYSSAAVGDSASLVIRPEAAQLAEHGLLDCEVTLSTFMGSYQYYHAKVGDVTVQITDYNPVNKRIYEAGEHTKLNFDLNGVYIL